MDFPAPENPNLREHISNENNYTENGDPEGSGTATIKRADEDPIQSKGPHKEENGGNKESGCRGYTNQVPAEGGEGRQ